MSAPGVTPTDDPRTAPGTLHPLVRVHPETGRRGLYLGRRRNAYIDGLPLEESDALLDEVWRHATDDRLTWRHQLAARRPGVVGQPLHDAPARRVRCRRPPRHAPDTDSLAPLTSLDYRSFAATTSTRRNTRRKLPPQIFAICASL